MGKEPVLASEDCLALKPQIEALIRQGKLQHFVGQ